MAAAAMFFGGLDHGSDGARPVVVVVFAIERGEDEFQRFVVVGPAEGDGLQLTKFALRRSEAANCEFLSTIRRRRVVQPDVAWLTGNGKGRAATPCCFGELAGEFLRRSHFRNTPDSIRVQHQSPPLCPSGKYAIAEISSLAMGAELRGPVRRQS
jgi:hypothetical protein